MKTCKVFLFILFSIGMNIGAHAQEGMTENPRGVYKLIDFVGKGGKTYEASSDQYKICTDSVTLTLTITKNHFEFKRLDGDMVFNYTGVEPDAESPHASRIYDSNEQRFSVKWWCEGYTDRPLFPASDWCIEHYESGKFSQTGKEIMDAFMLKNYENESNPLIGVWQSVGSVKNPQDKEAVSRVFAMNESKRVYRILTPTHLLLFEGSGGTIVPVKINGKDSFDESFEKGVETHSIIWISHDTIAVEMYPKYSLWVRTAKEYPLIAEIPVNRRAPKREEAPQQETNPYVKYIVRAGVGFLDVADMKYPQDKYKKLCMANKLHGHYASSSMSKSLAAHYERYFKKDLLQIYGKYCKKNLSMECVQRLNDLYETPQAHIACEHESQMRKKMREGVIPDVIKNVLSSGVLPPVPQMKECPENYKQAVHTYSHLTNANWYMLHRYEKLVSELDKKEQKKLKKLLPALSAYMETNMPVLLQNACLDFMTEEDLKELAGIAETPEGRLSSEMNVKFATMMDDMFNSKKSNEVVYEMEQMFLRFAESNTYVQTIQTTRYIPTHRSSGRYY